MTSRRARWRVWQRVLALAACTLTVISSTLPLFAAPAGSGDDSLTLTGDRVEYNSQTRRVRADGHVKASGRGAVITADHLEGDLGTQEIMASGNVTLSQGEKTITASLLRYNLQTRIGRVEKAAGQEGPWHVSAGAIDVGPVQDVATEASITPCDPAHPLYLVTAKKIVIVPGEYFTAYNASLWVAGTRIVTLPSYTSRVGGRSGPSFGYDTLDGVYLQYSNSFLLGGARDDYRIRLATTTGPSAENNLYQRFGSFVWSLDLGRTQLKNRGGVTENIDRYAIDVGSDRLRIPEVPVDFQFEGHGGSYGEIARGVVTTRVGAAATFATDTFVIGENLYLSAGARVHVDAYGTGDQQTVFEGSAALSGPLGPGTRMSLIYSGVAVNGSTPFVFDAYGPTSTLTMNLTHFFGGFLQSAGVYTSYDFLAAQTTVGLSAAMSINPNTAFNISAYYNVSTGQLTEVDYAINVRCDCVTVGLVYQTFPFNPAANMLMVSVELNAFPGRTVTFSGTGVKSE